MPNAEGLARPPIDAEELAAFIDGRLEGERRQRVIERLAEDEEAYELYSAVIEVREALETEVADSAVPQVPPASEGGAAALFRPATPAGPEGGRTRRRGKLLGWWRSERSRTSWLPAAAAIAAGVAVTVLAVWWVLRPTGSRQLLAAFDAGTVSPPVARAALDRLEPAYRGVEEERAAQFKLGARAFDLALAVEAGEPESAARWLDEMSRLLEQVPASFGLPEIYQSLAVRLDEGEPPRSLRRDVAEAEREIEAALDLPEQPLFAFGRWLEAVRTAAAHGDRTFLASSAAHEPLQAFLASSPQAAVSSRLEEIGAALGSGAAGADLDAVAQHAIAAIRHCADGSPCLGPS